MPIVPRRGTRGVPRGTRGQRRGITPVPKAGSFLRDISDDRPDLVSAPPRAQHRSNRASTIAAVGESYDLMSQALQQAGQLLSYIDQRKLRADAIAADNQVKAHAAMFRDSEASLEGKNAEGSLERLEKWSEDLAGQLITDDMDPRLRRALQEEIDATHTSLMPHVLKHEREQLDIYETETEEHAIDVRIDDIFQAMDPETGIVDEQRRGESVSELRSLFETQLARDLGVDPLSGEGKAMVDAKVLAAVQAATKKQVFGLMSRKKYKEAQALMESTPGLLDEAEEVNIHVKLEGAHTRDAVFTAAQNTAADREGMLAAMDDVKHLGPGAVEMARIAKRNQISDMRQDENWTDKQWAEVVDVDTQGAITYQGVKTFDDLIATPHIAKTLKRHPNLLPVYADSWRLRGPPKEKDGLSSEQRDAVLTAAQNTTADREGMLAAMDAVKHLGPEAVEMARVVKRKQISGMRQDENWTDKQWAEVVDVDTQGAITHQGVKTFDELIAMPHIAETLKQRPDLLPVYADSWRLRGPKEEKGLSFEQQGKLVIEAHALDIHNQYRNDASGAYVEMRRRATAGEIPPHLVRAAENALVDLYDNSKIIIERTGEQREVMKKTMRGLVWGEVDVNSLPEAFLAEATKQELINAQSIAMFVGQAQSRTIPIEDRDDEYLAADAMLDRIIAEGQVDKISDYSLREYLAATDSVGLLKLRSARAEEIARGGKPPPNNTWNMSKEYLGEPAVQDFLGSNPDPEETARARQLISGILNDMRNRNVSIDPSDPAAHETVNTLFRQGMESDANIEEMRTMESEEIERVIKNPRDFRVSSTTPAQRLEIARLDENYGSVGATTREEKRYIQALINTARRTDIPQAAHIASTQLISIYKIRGFQRAIAPTLPQSVVDDAGIHIRVLEEHGIVEEMLNPLAAFRKNKQKGFPETEGELFSRGGMATGAWFPPPAMSFGDQ